MRHIKLLSNSVLYKYQTSNPSVVSKYQFDMTHQTDVIHQIWYMKSDFDVTDQIKKASHQHLQRKSLVFCLRLIFPLWGASEECENRCSLPWGERPPSPEPSFSPPPTLDPPTILHWKDLDTGWSDILWGCQDLICTALKPYKTNGKWTFAQILVFPESTEITKHIKFLRENWYVGLHRESKSAPFWGPSPKRWKS